MTVAVPEDNNQFILIKGDTGTDKSYYMYLRGVDDNIWFEVSSTGALNYSMPAGLKDNWHHLAGTFNGSILSIYYDGILRSTMP